MNNMKHRIIYIVCLLTAVAFSGQAQSGSDAVVPDTALPACRNTEITFTADIAVAGMTKLQWDFGDGTSVEDTNMSQSSFTQKHTYAKRGTYILTVTPYNAGGAITGEVKTLSVKINSCALPVNHNLSVTEN